MVAILFYIFFFAALDICIIASLTGIIKIPKQIKLAVWLLTPVVVVAHFVIADSGFLFPAEEFLKIFMFSPIMVVLHFMSRRVSARMVNNINSNPQLAGTTFAAKYTTITGFIKNRLLYIMIFAFQVIAICTPGIRKGMTKQPVNVYHHPSQY